MSESSSLKYPYYGVNVLPEIANGRLETRMVRIILIFRVYIVIGGKEEIVKDFQEGWFGILLHRTPSLAHNLLWIASGIMVN